MAPRVRLQPRLLSKSAPSTRTGFKIADTNRRIVERAGAAIGGLWGQRSLIGDRTAGIVFDADGALTITISHDRPARAKEAANGLPARLATSGP
jgi:hypothetical protein